MQPEKKAKRVVSKGSYVKTQVLRMYEWIVIIYLFGVILLSIRFVVLRWPHNYSFIKTFSGLSILCMGAVMYCVARMCIKELRARESVVPFTRANIAHLSATESLVRPSEKPMQANENVLLRAVAEVPDISGTELLRPSNDKI